MAPCGEGIWSESLTSYINRLARLHSVPPQHLVVREIVPQMSQSTSQYPLFISQRSTGVSINGNGLLAREWSGILERLTKRTDLHFLTLQWWVGDLPPYKQLREQPAWCPACYAEWKEQGMPVYELLLWRISTVTICLKHLCNLEEYCPVCEKRQTFLRVQTDMDECKSCKAWLGSTKAPLVPLNPEIIEWQRWVINALEELRSALAMSTLPPWEQFFTNVSKSCEGRGEQSRLAELAGLARGQLATWLRRSCTPTLQSLLEFCYVCDVTPFQILTGNCSSLKQIIQEGKPCRLPRARRSLRLLDQEYCLERIQAILDGREGPLGYVQLAQQLGTTGNILRHHFPQECALLSQQIKAHRRQRAEQRELQIQEEIRQEVLALHAQGIYPSHRQVLARMARPTLLRHPKARAFRLALCRDLGWEFPSH
jgi:transcriptional regulator with XRE-family HTH domain